MEEDGRGIGGARRREYEELMPRRKREDEERKAKVENGEA